MYSYGEIIMKISIHPSIKGKAIKMQDNAGKIFWMCEGKRVNLGYG